MPSRTPAAKSPHAALLSELLETLKANGLRVTQPRIAMLECLLHAPQPMSIDEVRTQAGPGREELIWTTVYRFLLELERLKLVRRVHVSESLAHFELSLPHRHHDHLVCNGCGTVKTLEESCPVTELERRIASRYGFTEVTHSLEFHGLCPSCSHQQPHAGKRR